MGGRGPEGHGLARFTPGLEPEWLYPYGELPPIADCYALNVAGGTAYCCPYTHFYLIAVTGGHARDIGPVPTRGATCLLVDGDRAALIGGYGPEYDLVSPLRITASGIEPDGPLHPRPGRHRPAAARPGRAGHRRGRRARPGRLGGPDQDLRGAARRLAAQVAATALA
jgi:hypothetical protein